MPNVSSAVSAVNAILEFTTPGGGSIIEAGLVRNLTFSTNFNQRSQKTIYSKEVQNFVGGVQENRASASTIQLDPFSLFEGLVLNSNAFTTMTNLSNSVSSLYSGDVLGAVGDLINAVVDFSKQATNQSVKTLSEQFLQAQNSAEMIYASVEFSIRVRLPEKIAPYLDVIPLFPPTVKDVWVMEGCKLASSSITINIDNVLILNDCEIVFKRFRPSSPPVKPPSVLSGGSIIMQEHIPPGTVLG